MRQRDTHHSAVRSALEKDGWTITHDPLLIQFGRRNVFVDLGAGRPLAAEKDGRKIAVEVKSFMGPSDITELERALGQYTLYTFLLSRRDPGRTMYLALPATTYQGLLDDVDGRDLVTAESIRLIVFDLNEDNRAMDRIEEYRQIIKRIIEEYAVFKPSYGDVEVETIFDEVRDHYEMMYAGWDQNRRIHGSVIHVDIRDGKVWIQHDGIEDGITPELMEAGIPAEDIVLAFHHPDARKYGKFAVG